MDDSDDPVVQEIPVFLSQALAKNLYIYQFPVKPGNRDWKDAQMTNAAVKPKNQIVRLEVGLDTYSEKYCPSKGEQIALNTDGYQESKFIKEKDKERSQYFKSGVMDKIVYESCNSGIDPDRYAVALLQDKELHCTPVSGILQLKPSYSYYDKQDKRKKESDKVENSEEEDEEPEAQQVTVKFARQESEVTKKAREKSYEFMSKAMSEEPWYDGMWHHSNTDQAELERLKLFSGETSNGTSLSLRSREYVRALVPAPPEDEADVAPTKLAPPADQIKELLRDAKVLTFNDLRRHIKTEDGMISESALLSIITASACCVRGLWTARSVDLYTQSTPPPKLMCAARDHVLYLFTQRPYIERSKIAATARLPQSDVLNIMKSVAKYNDRLGWVLNIPPDVAFEEKHPDLVLRQHLYLEGRERLFNEMMLNENTPKRQRKKSQRDSISSDTMSPKVRCTSVSEEDGDRKRVRNKSVSGTGKRTRHVSLSSNHDAA